MESNRKYIIVFIIYGILLTTVIFINRFILAVYLEQAGPRIEYKITKMNIDCPIIRFEISEGIITERYMTRKICQEYFSKYSTSMELPCYNFNKKLITEYKIKKTIEYFNEYLFLVIYILSCLFFMINTLIFLDERIN